MSRFLESILIQNGSMPLLSYHQTRVDQTLLDHDGSPISLLAIAKTLTLPLRSTYKLRMEYDIEGNHSIEVIPYQQKLIASLRCIDIGDYSYNYKFADRSSIQNFYADRDRADDILMIKNGLVTDTSYGNVAFYDNGTWTTPTKSLLEGCRRKHLLEKKRIAIKNIGIEDLLQFQYICIFNAMIPLGRILIPTSRIILPS